MLPHTVRLENSLHRRLNAREQLPQFVRRRAGFPTPLHRRLNAREQLLNAF